MSEATHKLGRICTNCIAAAIGLVALITLGVLIWVAML